MTTSQTSSPRTIVAGIAAAASFDGRSVAANFVMLPGKSQWIVCPVRNGRLTGKL